MINVDGEDRDAWGLNWMNLPVGTYGVCFGPAPAATGPGACSVATITTANTTTVAGTYAPKGFLRVLTSPAVPATITIEDASASKAPGSTRSAVVIAVLGIGTTIGLSVRERTRELGVLRSIGMTRAQIRRTIRFEAVSIALLGTVLGAAIGLGCTWAILQTLADSGFAAPVLPDGALVTVAIGAVVAGKAAAAMPARRASRLAILDAVRTA